MANGKKYFWIKLKKDFLTGEVIDFLMAQNNGSQYVVLYLLLCMMCINTDGKLEQKLGEAIVPFDVDKIQRDCKYFSRDTIVVALQLYKKLGLIYEDADGSLVISDYREMVGSSTDYAIQKASQRARIADKQVDSIVDKGVDNVHTEIRDKSIETESEIDKDITVPNGTVRCTDVQRIVDAWNALSDVGIKPISKLTEGSKRKKNLMARVRQYGGDQVLAAIDRIRQSNFLQGHNNRGWTISFDWFVLPNNFPKVLEGNYDNSERQSNGYYNRFAHRAEEVDSWKLS